MKTDKKKLSKAIGNRIKEKRKEKHFTQSQVAEIMGLSDQYISQIEAGKVNLSLNRLVDMADILDVSLSYLLNGEAEEYNMIAQKMSCLSRRDKRIIENIIDDMLKD